jgi:predicted RNA-binding protein YlqC (UPF0109 family)
MESFLEFVVKGLVKTPDEVTITHVGRIIGKDGRTINAIRSLLTAGSARKGLRCMLEIVEEEDEGEPPR